MAAVAGCRGLQVVAGAEHPAGARQDRDMLRAIGVESTKRRRQGVRRQGIDRVAGCRTVDRDDRHLAFSFVANGRGLGHGAMIGAGPPPDK